MKKCNPKVIVEGGYYNIAQCHCCKRLGLYYKNLLVSFEFDDFIAFIDSFCAVNFDKKSVLFPGKKKLLVINTCHKDIQFAFSKTEFEELRTSLQQAKLVLEANSLVSQQK